jgi:hypothetical protein
MELLIERMNMDTPAPPKVVRVPMQIREMV